MRLTIHLLVVVSSVIVWFCHNYFSVHYHGLSRIVGMSLSWCLVSCHVVYKFLIKLFTWGGGKSSRFPKLEFSLHTAEAAGLPRVLSVRGGGGGGFRSLPVFQSLMKGPGTKRGLGAWGQGMAWRVCLGTLRMRPRLSLGTVQVTATTLSAGAWAVVAWGLQSSDWQDEGTHRVFLSFFPFLRKRKEGLDDTVWPQPAWTLVQKACFDQGSFSLAQGGRL